MSGRPSALIIVSDMYLVCFGQSSRDYNKTVGGFEVLAKSLINTMCKLQDDGVHVRAACSHSTNKQISSDTINSG